MTAVDFGFNFNKEREIPVSGSRIILFHKDSLYDYRLGQREPALITPFAPDSKVFRLDGAFFVFNRLSGFLRLNVDTLRTMPVPLRIIDPVTSSANRHKQLFWENGMKNPILIEGSRAWKLGYGRDYLIAVPICTVVTTVARLY